MMNRTVIRAIMLSGIEVSRNKDYVPRINFYFQYTKFAIAR